MQTFVEQTIYLLWGVCDNSYGRVTCSHVQLAESCRHYARSPGFNIVVDAFVPPNNETASALAYGYLEGLFYNTWVNLTNGLAYQNYPSVLYQPRSTAVHMYYGSNLCRLIRIKKKVSPTCAYMLEAPSCLLH